MWFCVWVNLADIKQSPKGNFFLSNHLPILHSFDLCFLRLLSSLLNELKAFCTGRE